MNYISNKLVLSDLKNNKTYIEISNGYDVFYIEISKNFNMKSFKEELKEYTFEMTMIFTVKKIFK